MLHLLDTVKPACCNTSIIWCIRISFVM